MICISQLRFEYPKSEFVLNIDDLELGAGEKVAIVGPSGSGKTTLLNLIAGISVPGRGQITVDDVVISELSDAERRNFRSSKIGMVFQQFELIDYLTVAENILLPYFVNDSLKLSGKTRESAKTSAEQMGLGDKLRRTARKLSQGEQQRVAICRALINTPKLILADEPTGNLDPKNKSLIMKLLFKYCDQNKATLVVVTHDTNILDGFERTIDFETLLVDVAGGSAS